MKLEECPEGCQGICSLCEIYLRDIGELVQCYRCEGTGMEDATGEGESTCIVCHGSGEVPKIVTGTIVVINGKHRPTMIHWHDSGLTINFGKVFEQWLDELVTKYGIGEERIEFECIPGCSEHCVLIKDSLTKPTACPELIVVPEWKIRNSITGETIVIPSDEVLKSNKKGCFSCKFLGSALSEKSPCYGCEKASNWVARVK